MTKKILRSAAVLLLLLILTVLVAACGYVDSSPCPDGHKWMYESTSEPDCLHNSHDVYYCTSCGAKENRDNPNTALGHQLEKLVCTVCGYIAPIPEDTPDVFRQGPLLFTLDRNKRGYTVKVSSGSKVQGDCTIPATLYELPVIAVEDQGFQGQTDITQIVFPDCLTNIGKSAFEGCTGLTSLTVGSGVATIGDRAFYGCVGLIEIVAPKSVSRIGEAAFGGCGKLQRLVIPFVGRDKAINYRAYEYDYTLGYIFGKKNYNGAQKVTMTYRKVTSHGTGYESAAYYIPASLRTVEVTVGGYQYHVSSDANGYLEYGAFHNCTMIKEIVLAPSVTVAQSGALDGLSGLERLIAPGLRMGGTSAQKMPALREIDCIGSGKYNIPKVTLRQITAQDDLSQLADCDRIEELTLVFAENVKTVKRALLEPIFDKITGLELTSMKTVIEEGALEEIVNLKRAALPYEMLSGLTMTCLEELTVLSDGAYRIPEGLFASATALRTLTLDSHVTGFDEGAFASCTRLSSVTLDGTGENLSRDALLSHWLALSFGGEGANPLCHGAGLYFETEADRTPVGEVTLPEALTELGAFVFDGCNNLTELTFGSHLRAVGTSAFRGTTALLTVHFDGTLTEWLALDFASGDANPLNGAQSFYVGETKITALRVGAGITEISPYAFYGYLGLASVSLEEGILRIGTSAFFGCTALAEVLLPATLTRVDALAFAGCTALASAHLAAPDSWYLFESATSVVGAPIPASALADIAYAAEYFVTLYPDYIFKKVG